MPRLRTIKPGFFTNEDLADCGPHAMLLFAGLWCHADREGRLEDRPRRLKVEILPYFDVEVDALLGRLAAGGFVVRYECGGIRYLAIPTFGKHQNPHIKEAGSTLPAPPEPVPAPGYKGDSTGKELCSSGVATVLAPDEHQTSTVLSVRSLVLGPWSFNPPLPPQGGVAADIRGTSGGHPTDAAPTGDVTVTSPPTSPIRTLAPATPSRASVVATLTEPANGSPSRQLWDAFVTLLGTAPVTRSERGKWNGAIKELVAVGATPTDVAVRAAAYRRRWPTVDLNPRALAAHWSEFGGPTGGNSNDKPQRLPGDGWDTIAQQRRDTAPLGSGGG